MADDATNVRALAGAAGGPKRPHRGGDALVPAAVNQALKYGPPANPYD